MATCLESIFQGDGMGGSDPRNDSNDPKSSSARRLALVVSRSWWKQALIGVLLAAFVYVAVAPKLVPLLVPISFYYNLDSVHVEDATYGESPTMVVASSIARPFRGWREVQIERVVGSEYELYGACGVYSLPEASYGPTRELPDPLTLDWWMGIPPNRECRLPPGDYRIVTTSYVRSLFDALLTKRVPSNTFTIL
jgi:hypothetical protein